MSYLAGLLTIPAIAGTAFAVWGLWRGTGWLIEHGIVLRLTPQHEDQVAATAAAVASSPRVWAVRVLPNYGTVLIAFGKCDSDRLAKVHKATLTALRPLAPAPKMGTRWTQGAPDAD